MNDNISKGFFKRLDANGIKYVKATLPSGRVWNGFDKETVKEYIYTCSSKDLNLFSPSSEKIPWEQLMNEILTYYITKNIPIFYQLRTYNVYRHEVSQMSRRYVLRAHEGFLVDKARVKYYTIYGETC